MIVALGNIVDSNKTSISSVVCAALFTTANLPDVLIVIPHVIPTDTAPGTLYKDSTATGLVAPAVYSESVDARYAC